jgi:endonuclease-3 related protein
MFEICVGALLTQNTSWTNVEKALAALRAYGLMSPEQMAAASPARLRRAVRSSGYFRQKAGRLRDFCRRVLRERPEGLRRWFAAAPAAALRAELLSYKGIGPETADCIVLYAACKPSFVVDAYTRRIGGRLGLGPRADYAAWQALFEAALPPDVKVYNEYHALLVKLGKDLCRKTGPRCGACPLAGICPRLL